MLLVYDKKDIGFKGSKEQYKRFLSLEHNRTLNAEDTLDFTIPLKDYKTIENEDFVEYKGIYFIVKNVEFIRDNAGKVVNVSCVHIKQLLLDKIISVKDGPVELFGKTVREVLERIIIGTPFKLGIIEDFGTWDIEIGDRNALDVLYEVVQNWNFDGTEIIPDKPVSSILDFGVSFDQNTIGLTWSENDDNWLGTRIVLNKTRVPSHENDGTVIYINNIKNKHRVNPYKYQVEYNTTYYLKPFPYNDQEVFNRDSNHISINLTEDIINTNPPEMVNSLTAVYNQLENCIQIKFDETNITDYLQTIICKGTKMPISINDGKLITNTEKNKYKVTPFKDFKVEKGVTYYYRAFTINDRGIINENSKTVTVTIPKEIVPDKKPPSPAIISKITYDNVESNAKININIIDPIDEDFEQTILVRNTDHYPINSEDGDVVLTNYEKDKYKVNPFIDTVPLFDSTYFYKTFVIDIHKNTNMESGISNIQVKKDQNTDCKVDKVNNVIIGHKDNNLLIRWTDPNSYWFKTKVIVSETTNGIFQKEFTTRNMYQNTDLKVPVEYNTIYTITFLTYDLDNKTNSYSENYTISKTDIIETLPTIDLNGYYENGVKITFSDSISEDFKETIIIKHTEHIPENINDGSLVVKNAQRDRYKDVPFVDSNVVNGKRYYYRAFTKDNQDNITNGNSFIIDIPLIQDTIPPSITKNIRVTTNGNSVYLNWEDGSDDDWAGVALVKSKTIPQGVGSGLVTKIYTKNKYSSTPYIDNIEYDTKYYYALYPFDTSGNYNLSQENIVSVIINSNEYGEDPTAAIVTLTTINGKVYMNIQDPLDHNWTMTRVYRLSKEEAK